MEAANSDCLDRFFTSETLCLENCHDDRNRSFASEHASDNILLNQYAPGYTIDAITTNLSQLQLVLSDLIRQVEGGNLEYWSAFYKLSTATEALYKRRNENLIKPLLFWFLKGLWKSLEIQWRPMQTPFLTKLIMLLESQNHFLDAIEICNYAIDKKIPDSTQNGYDGKKRRVEKKLNNETENLRIDWSSVCIEAITFFNQLFNEELNKQTDKIKLLAKQIKTFCEKSEKLPTQVRVKEFYNFKQQILPEIEAGMISESEQAIRATWDSYRWLYKEFFKLESEYWMWCGYPILVWYRDTEQKPDTWPSWLIRQYGFRTLEYKLYSNLESFTARDLYALTESPLTDWGKQHGFTEILSNVENWLKMQLDSNGKCYVRKYFEDTSFWAEGELSQKENYKHLKIFKDLIEIGKYQSKRSLLDQPLNVCPLLFYRNGGEERNLYETLYDFPQGKDLQLFRLPEIPKLNLANEINKVFRQAENDVRSQAGLPEVGAGWVSESQLVAFISNSFPDEVIVTQGSPPWLGRQRFDIYLPKQKIAIEYQGIQHFEPVDFFGGEEGFKKNQERDALKRKKCKENGCALIEVLPNYEETELVEKIQKLISLVRV